MEVLTPKNTKNPPRMFHVEHSGVGFYRERFIFCEVYVNGMIKGKMDALFLWRCLNNKCAVIQRVYMIEKIIIVLSS